MHHQRCCRVCRPLPRRTQTVHSASSFGRSALHGRQPSTARCCNFKMHALDRDLGGCTCVRAAAAARMLDETTSPGMMSKTLSSCTQTAHVKNSVHLPATMCQAKTLHTARMTAEGQQTLWHVKVAMPVAKPSAIAVGPAVLPKYLPPHRCNTQLLYPKPVVHPAVPDTPYMGTATQTAGVAACWAGAPGRPAAGSAPRLREAAHAADQRRPHDGHRVVRRLAQHEQLRHALREEVAVGNLQLLLQLRRLHAAPTPLQPQRWGNTSPPKCCTASCPHRAHPAEQKGPPNAAIPPSSYQ